MLEFWLDTYMSSQSEDVQSLRGIKYKKNVLMSNKPLHDGLLNISV